LQSISRIALIFLIAVVTSLGAFTLSGCGGDDQQSQSASSAASSASGSQDNCYGNDLPAKK
jgi:osmotically-inducible protein OsmY